MRTVMGSILGNHYYPPPHSSVWKRNTDANFFYLSSVCLWLPFQSLWFVSQYLFICNSWPEPPSAHPPPPFSCITVFLKVTNQYFCWKPIFLYWLSIFFFYWLVINCPKFYWVWLAEPPSYTPPPTPSRLSVIYWGFEAFCAQNLTMVRLWFEFAKFKAFYKFNTYTEQVAKFINQCRTGQHSMQNNGKKRWLKASASPMNMARLYNVGRVCNLLILQNSSGLHKFSIKDESDVYEQYMYTNLDKTFTGKKYIWASSWDNGTFHPL